MAQAADLEMLSTSTAKCELEAVCFCKASVLVTVLAPIAEEVAESN